MFTSCQKGCHVITICRLAGWGLLLCGVSASAAELTFYCPFDGTVDAQFAAGEPGAICRKVSFTEGHRGQAIAIPDAEHLMCFDAAGNLPKNRGTIELWIKGDWDGSDRTWRGLVWDDAEGKLGDMALWFWKYESTIRFDIRDAAGHNVTGPIDKWRRGQWHHLAACYDCESGVKLYLDGKPAAERHFQWKPRNHGAFYVGARQDSNYPAEAAIDELKIYNAPLSDAEVAQAFRGELNVPHARRLPPAQDHRPATHAPPRLIFRLPLDGDLAATTALGRREPSRAQGIQWTDGMTGKAARFGAGSRLAYSAAGNLRKDRGTIALWYRPDFPPQHEGRHAFFRENGPNEKGQNAMWLWLWNQVVRFDVREPGDKYLVRNVAAWQPGEWHFLAATWDARQGRTLYVDGVAARAAGDSQSDFSTLSWETKSYDQFFVGSDGGRDAADGAIAEFKIYDGPLPAKEIAREFTRRFPVKPLVTNPYYLAGREATFTWQLRNLLDEETHGTLRWELVAEDQSRLAAGGPAAITLAAGTEQTWTAKISPKTAGRITLCCHWSGRGASAAYERTVDSWAIPPESAPATGSMSTRLVDEIDCTQPLDSRQYVDDGQSHVVRSAAGAYREAGAKRHSRLAYRIRTADVGQPYLIEWTYPDDKARTMDVVLQVTSADRGMYDLQTGVFCGGEYPTSGRMLSQRAVVWPRAADQALVFMTAENDRPAAVARIRIARIEGRLPALPVRPAPPRDGWQRLVGLYYEDPVLPLNFGGQDAMPGFAAVTDRLLDYMDWSGQNVLMYPAVWYRGPFFPNHWEPQLDAEHGRPHPPNFIRYLGLRMSQRNMVFIPTFNVHSLPSLAEQAVTDDRQIRAGRETTLMMMWNNRPKTVGWHGTPPNFNPLSTEAQRQFTRLVDEMLDLYGDLPAFKGICFHLTQHSILWFGSLDAGYNDTNIERFEAETGRQIPVARRDPLRFNKRYRWLMENAQQAWIDWRCQKIHEYYATLARRLAARRPDLRLIVNLYVPSSPDEKMSIFKSAPRDEILQECARRAGLDIRLFAHEPNIVVQRTLFPADYRWTRVHRPLDADTAISRQINYVDGCFAALRTCDQVWINQHDRYWEDNIGHSSPLRGLWGGETGWRVSTLNPNPRHCLELYAWSLASTDAFAFTKGGFVVGTIGMEEPLGRFAQALRALPAVKFSDVPGLFDPVAVRQHHQESRTYFYAVNRLSCPVELHLELSGQAEVLTDLSTGQPVAGDAANGKQLQVTLPPYALRSFSLDGPDVRVSGGYVDTPAAYVQEIRARLADLQRRAAAQPVDEAPMRGLPDYFAEAQRLAGRGCWGQLHFLLEDTHATGLEGLKP
jgi:hypothetical protein